MLVLYTRLFVGCLSVILGVNHCRIVIFREDYVADHSLDENFKNILKFAKIK